MKLGVFDSGIGGKAIAMHLEESFPDAEVVYVNDHKNVPYGTKSHEDIFRLTHAAIQPLLLGKCDIIILACNTATAAAINKLREIYPTQKFIGLEPMVKTAVDRTKTKIVTICATPYTLQSERYKKLKAVYAQGVRVIEPDCSNWATMIEHSDVDDRSIQTVVDQALNTGSDVLVLACTHYHWIKQKIIELAGDNIEIIDPSDAIVRRVRQLLD